MFSEKILRLTLLLGFIFISAVMDTAFCAQEPLSSLDAQLEKSKWSYLQGKLVEQEASLASFSNKLGQFIGKYPMLFSMPLAGAAGFITAYVCSTKIDPDVFYIYHGHHMPYGMDGVPGDNLFSQFLYFVGDPAATMYCSGGIALMATLAVTYGLSKTLSHWLQDRPELCFKVLKKYMNEWLTHKANTPSVLYPMFDTLHADFITSGGKFTKISSSQAIQIIESLLAVSITAGLIE